MNRTPADVVDRAGPRLLLVWAGLAIGVAFLATPAKFLAPSLSLTAALDVGRQTFAVFNRLELCLLIVLVLLGAASSGRRRWYAALVVPGAVVLAQALWLIPALDARVSAILAGATVPPSRLHALYIALEALKVLALLGFGWADGRRLR